MTRTDRYGGIEHTADVRRLDRTASPPVNCRCTGTPPGCFERNVVITEWDWADPTAYMHDVVSTDRRNPTVNAYGKLYGATEESADYPFVLDPVNNTIDQIASWT